VTILGGVQAHSTVGLPAFPDLSSVVFPASNLGDANLEPSVNRTILPGAYNTVRVATGATLNLSSGTYFFNSFDLEPQGTVTLDQTHGPITIYIKTWLAYRASFVDPSGSYAGFFVGYFGTGLTLEAPFNGVLVAPNAAMTLGVSTSTTFTGDFFAKGLALTPNTVVVCKSNLTQ
jgi:hypothetical protein